MKKAFGIFAALAFSASLMSANTANFVIYVESPDNNEIYDELVMAENAEFSMAYENLKDAEKMADANNPSLYGYVENRKCGVIAANNLEGMLLTLETVGETNYDISFYGVAGTTYYLIDLVGGSSTQIAEGNTLHLTGVATNSTLADRFLISKSSVTPATSVTTNAYGWATFSYTSDVEPVNPASKVYKGTISGELLNLTEVDYVKAGEGVIVHGAPSTTYYFAVGNGTADFSDNDIKPSSAWTGAADNIYCLKGDALYQYTGTEMPANKAYIQIGGSSAPQRIRMVINGAQGIEDVEATVKAEKFVENGQIFIRRGEHVYDLQGQIVK